MTGYRALVDPAAVGLGFEALVQVTLERGDAGPSPPSKRPWSGCRKSGTRSAYSAIPTTCCGSSRGTSTAMRTLRDQKLATLPGLHRLTSTIVMKRIVENRPVPLTARGD